MKSFVKTLLLAFILIGYFACQKDVDNLPTPPNGTDTIQIPVIPQHYDSIKVVTRLRSYSFGDEVYTYDNQNRVASASCQSPSYAGRSLKFFYLPDGKISHVVSSADSTVDPYNPSKSSAVFTYNANGQISNAYHKVAVYRDKPDNDVYFASISNANEIMDHDSVIYTSNGSVSDLYRYGSPYRTFPLRVKYYYATPADSMPTKIERFAPDVSGIYSLAHRITIRADSNDNPVYKYLRFSFFLSRVALIARNFYAMSFLYERPSTPMGEYLALVPKCISYWKTEEFGPTGIISDYNTYIYTYSADSTSFIGSIPNFYGGPYAEYQFTKVRKR